MRGFSLLELIVTIVVVLVVLGVFLERALYYQELAEKTAMERVAWDIRSSVNLKTAELVLANRFAEIAALAAQNPLDLLGQKPANYLGVRTSSAAATVPGGNWYYDNGSKEVVYCVVLGRYFDPDALGRKCAAWRVVVMQGAGQGAAPQWARFEIARPYKWF